MTDQEKRQIELIAKHLEKAVDAKDDEERQTHEIIARTLFEGLDARYKVAAESLSNLAQSL